MKEGMKRIGCVVGLLALVLAATVAGFVLSFMLAMFIGRVLGTGGKNILPRHLQWMDDVAFLPTLILPIWALIVGIRIDRQWRAPTTACSRIAHPRLRG